MLSTGEKVITNMLLINGLADSSVPIDKSGTFRLVDRHSFGLY